MTQRVSASDRPATLPARDLAPGVHITALDHIETMSGTRAVDTVAEVRYTLPYTDPDGAPRIAVMTTRVRTGQPWEIRYLATEPVTLATPTQIAEASARRPAGFGADDPLAGTALDHPVTAYAPVTRRAAYNVVHAGIAAGLPIPMGIYVYRSRALILDFDPADRSAVGRWAARLGLPAPALVGPTHMTGLHPLVALPGWMANVCCPVEPGVVTVDGAAMAEAVAVVNAEAADLPTDDGLCPDPWHEQTTIPTEPCPACGDPAPVPAEASAYSPAVVAAIGTHLAESRTESDR